VTSLDRKFTRAGDLMATFVLEDLLGSVEVMVFPKVMIQVDHLIQPDAIVVVKGRLNAREEPAKLMALEVTIPELSMDSAPPLRVRIPSANLSPEQVDRLQAILKEHPGDQQVFLHLGSEGKVIRLPDQWCVTTANSVIAELKAAFGPDSIL
jgi:DNA polymerase III subunit alpha